MYPYFRLFLEEVRARRAPVLPLTGVDTGRHTCLPWDLDPWHELNNGRALTLYDLGRVAVLRRTGLGAVLRRQGWGIAVAGASVRYRQRVKLFDRVEITTRTVTWDARFLYMEQAMWKADGACASHILLRMAVTGPKGIVPPAQVLGQMGRGSDPPPVPDWIAAWIAAEGARPWPPDLQPAASV